MKKTLLIISVVIPFLFSCKKKEMEIATNKGTQLQQADYVKTDFYFRLPDYKGGEIKLEDYKGKPVLVMFFTETCPYCKKAAPYIESLHEKYNEKGLAVIGISTRDDKSSPQEFAKENNISFRLAYNGRETAKNYGIAGVPFIYLLDKSHNLFKVWAGYDRQYNNSIEEAINKVLN
ncbi:MAG: TlpA family protein disulfide reductase [Elusimicrobiota bacterium]